MKLNFKQTIAGATLVAGAALAAPANAIILLDNYDFYLDGGNGASAADAFLTGNGASGGQLLGIDAFQSNGNSFVVQELSGAGGTAVANGDRFYDVGYLRLETADVGGATTGLLSTLYANTSVTDNAALYFFFELTGTVSGIGGTTPSYTFDGGQLNLILDNDAGLFAGTIDDVINRASDGAQFSDLLTNVGAMVGGNTFDMAAATGGIPFDPTGAETIDGSLLTLMSLDVFFTGNANKGGELPTGFGVPNSQTTGDFGVDMAVTGTCVANVAFDEFGTDLCNSANAVTDLSEFFWSVSGQTTGKALSDAIQGTDATSGNGLIFQSLTVGDTADLATVPEPEVITLMGLGLLGFGVTRRRKV